MHKHLKLLSSLLVLLVNTIVSSSLEAAPKISQNAAGFLELKTNPLSQEEIKFLQAFPVSEYRVQQVDGQGYFYVDTIDDCIKNVLRTGSPWEPKTMAIIANYTLPDSIALDIGSHIGTHTITMSKYVGSKGKVFAFEPQLKIYRELVMNMKLNNCQNVVPLHFAVGEKNKAIHLGAPVNNNEGSRFISIKQDGEQVFMKTIDSFRFKNVSFIKIDVENYEEFVLEGARKTIKRCKPVILIEIQGNKQQASQVASDAITHMQKKREAVITKLEGMGYIVTHFNDADYLALPKQAKKRS